MSIRSKKEIQRELLVPYPNNLENKLLQKVRQEFQLDSIIDQKESDFRNILNLRFWIYSNLDKNGNTFAESEKHPKYLADITKKENFHISEYSSLSKLFLQALGYTARKVKLQNPGSFSKKDSFTHFLYEVYLNDLKKWFFIDQQYDIIITKDGIPLNAVELQLAFINEEELEVINPLKKTSSEEYLELVGPYLYYFSTDLNGKYNFITRFLRSKTKLILVPQYEDFPLPKNNLPKSRSSIITSTISDFYPALDN
ncbi:hypothetical protein ML462_03565 [Gramella lutea]|uniref:Uncharacterized protein n=1 Tax=Christiangramia lutea TaxID=1607951 RepID=A0A9X1V0V6_9FLAO|nr:hypothetical protein [Christiangramia lutea]MCH4822242.1 hypothetical protein [Christiangramia lutea]